MGQQTRRNGTVELMVLPEDVLDLTGVHETVRALLQQILAQSETIARYHAGTVRLAYHRTDVKCFLELKLPIGV